MKFSSCVSLFVAAQAHSLAQLENEAVAKNLRAHNSNFLAPSLIPNDPVRKVLRESRLLRKLKLDLSMYQERTKRLSNHLSLWNTNYKAFDDAFFTLQAASPTEQLKEAQLKITSYKEGMEADAIRGLENFYENFGHLYHDINFFGGGKERPHQELPRLYYDLQEQDKVTFLKVKLQALFQKNQRYANWELDDIIQNMSKRPAFTSSKVEDLPESYSSLRDTEKKVFKQNFARLCATWGKCLDRGALCEDVAGEKCDARIWNSFVTEKQQDIANAFVLEHPEYIPFRGHDPLFKYMGPAQRADFAKMAAKRIESLRFFRMLIRDGLPVPENYWKLERSEWLGYSFREMEKK